MSDVAKVASKVVSPVVDTVTGIAGDVAKVVGSAGNALGPLNPLQVFGQVSDVFGGLIGQVTKNPLPFSPIPLPFSPANLASVVTSPISTIKDAIFNSPVAVALNPTVKAPSLRPSNDLLAGAGEIDKLMDEARATLSDPNAKFEDKLAAQQKMSTAMTLFQFFSAIIKQFSDMANTVNSALR